MLFFERKDFSNPSVRAAFWIEALVVVCHCPKMLMKSSTIPVQSVSRCAWYIEGVNEGMSSHEVSEKRRIDSQMTR